MKILPCRPPAGRTGCPDGMAKAGTLLYYAQTWPGRPGEPLVYVCSACRTMTMLTATEFNSLPEATVEGPLEDHLAKDLTFGGAVSQDHARELFRAGVTPLELERLPAERETATAPAKRRRRAR